MTNIIPVGFRYSSNDHGRANLLIGLAHNIAANGRRSPIAAGTPVVAYVTDSVRRGTYFCAGMADGSDDRQNQWGPAYDDRTVYGVRWMLGPIWVPADVAWAPGNNFSGELLQQMLEYAMSS